MCFPAADGNGSPSRASHPQPRADQCGAGHEKPEQGRRRRQQQPEGTAVAEGEAEGERSEPGEGQGQRGGVVAVEAAEVERQPGHQGRVGDREGGEPREGRTSHGSF